MAACAQCGREVADGGSCPACSSDTSDAIVAEPARAEARASAPAGAERHYEPTFPVTKWLIGTNVAMFAAMVLLGHAGFVQPTPEQIERWGANFGPLVLNGQWWRLLANVFIHIGIVHLLLNMWTLWNVGALAETLFGEARYVYIYVFSGIAGSLASLAAHPFTASAGASGAIFGIAGALIITLKFAHLHAPREAVAPILRSLVLFAIFNLVYGAKAGGVDNAAHLGGLIGGVLAASMAIQPFMRGSETGGTRRLVAGAGAVALMAVAMGVARLNAYVPHFYRGLKASQQQNQVDTAIAEFRKTIELKPRFSEAHLLLAQMYIRKQDLKSAQARLLRAIELDNRDAEAWSTLARLYAQTGALPPAADAWARAVQIEPRNAPFHLEYANVLFAMGHLNEGIAEAKRATEANPDYVTAWFVLGVAASQKQDFDTAVHAFEQVVRLSPQSPDAHATLAGAYERKGMQKEAAAENAEAAKLRAEQQKQQQTPPGSQARGGDGT